MATRYTVVGAVAGVSAAVIATFIAMSGTERAQSLGLTRHGELVVAVDGGAADVVGLVGVTPGTPAQVLTVSDAGVPHWATAGGGGSGTAGSGTYAARPVSPAVGDTYRVTEGERLGSTYRCTLDGAWGLDYVTPPVTAEFFLDAERLPARTGAFVTTWPSEVQGSGGGWGARRYSTPAANLSVVASAAGGLPAAAFSGGTLIADWQGPSGTNARWMAAVVSSVSGFGSYWACLAAYGTASTNQLWGIWSYLYSIWITANWGINFYNGAWNPGIVPDATSATHLVVMQYTGTQNELFIDTNTAVATDVRAINTGSALSLVIGTDPSGTANTFSGRLHAFLAGSGTLDSGDLDDLISWAQARYGTP